MTFLESQSAASKIAKIDSRSVVHLLRVGLSGLFGLAAAINLVSFLSSASLFPKAHLAAVVLSLYLLVEARVYLRRSDAMGLLSPALLALVFHFFFSYLIGITSAAFQPRIMDRFTYWLPNLDASLASTLLMGVMAAFCMMRGYSLGRPIARKLLSVVQRINQIRHTIRPAIGLAVGFQFAYIGLVSYSIDRGIYGLLSTSDSRAPYLNLLQFFNFALAAGTLSYFLILLLYFQRRDAGRAGAIEGVLVVLMIAMHVLAGVLAAFKSQIVFPFVIAGLAYFLVMRRISLLFISLSLIALITSYVIVEPFRVYLGWRGQPPQSILEAVDSVRASQEMRESLAHFGDVSMAESVASRFDLLGMSSLAVDYVDSGELHEYQRQYFKDSIFLAPILAYVPRAIWEDKPSFSEGVWFNQNVLGRLEDQSTSVGMGPIGILYMASSSMGVVLGFFVFGIFQSLIFEGFGRAGFGGLIMFLSVAGTLVLIPTSFGPAISGMLQILPAAFLAQVALLRPSRIPGRTFG